MAFGFRSSLGLVTVILSCRRRSWCGKKMASCPPTDSLALPCLALKLGARNLCFQIIVVLDTFPTRPDPAPSQDTDTSPAVVLSCTPDLPKSTSHNREQNRDELARGIQDCVRPFGSRWRSLSHIPRTLRHKRHKSKKGAVTPKPIGEVAYVHMKKQANCLETRNAFTFVIILEASIALEFVSHPMVLSTQNTPSVLRKLWPVPPEQETL